MGFEGSYLWKLRQALGSQRLLVPGVGLIVTNPEGKVWMGKRTDSGEWSYPGGGMELGRGVLDIASEEMLEETGIAVKPEDWTLVALHTDPAETNYTYPNGDAVQIVNMIFQTMVESEITVGDDEHSEFGLFDVDALPQPMKPDSEKAMVLYRDYLKSGKVQVR